MATQLGIAFGGIVVGFAKQITKGGRQPVRAVFQGRPAELPKCLLEPFGQGREALATDDCGSAWKSDPLIGGIGVQN